MSLDDLLEALVTRDGIAWKQHGACVNLSLAMFFPTRGESAQPAKDACAGCQVRDRCHAFALEHGEQHGVWGGLSEKQRKQLRNPPPRAEVAQCGTISGHSRHKRLHEAICADCRVAWNEYERIRRAS